MVALGDFFSNRTRPTMRAISGAILAVLIAIPGPAAAEFYIVQDIEKQTCVVAQAPPQDDKHVVVGDGAYGDEATANAELRKMLACNPGDAASSNRPQAPTGLKTQ